MACKGITKKPAVPQKSHEGEPKNLSKIIKHKNDGNKLSFHEWKFGTINIRSGKEKQEGAKMYMIAKEVAKLNLTFCVLQEVRHRNVGSKIIELNTGEKFQFYWCGQKKRRDFGVGILVRIDPRIHIFN